MTLLTFVFALVLSAKSNSAWVDSLISEGSQSLIAAQRNNSLSGNQHLHYTIVLDAKKWVNDLPNNSSLYPSLQQNQWYYEAGNNYTSTDGITEEQIESRLDSFNISRPAGDNLRFYSILIKNFPVKVNNPIANISNLDSNKNLFNQLVSLKVIDKEFYNNEVRKTFKAIIEKIVTDAQAQFAYQEIAVYGIGHMLVNYGPNAQDVIGFMAQYPVFKGGRLEAPQTNEYIRTSFNQTANKAGTPRKKVYEMVSVLAENIHCIIDGDCAPLAEPGNTYYTSWKNTQGVSPALIRLTAQYINLLGANLYADFKIVRGVPSGNWTSSQFEDYKTQIAMYCRYYQYFNTKIDSINTSKDMIVLCRHLTTNQFELFTIQQRLKILNKINESSLTDLQNVLSILNNGYGGENIVVKTIKYAPTAQNALLLDGLKQNNLLNDLIGKLDDAGIGADNFTQFVFGILNLIPQSSFDGNWDNLVNNNKVFKGDFSGSLLAGNAFTINLNDAHNGTLKVVTHVSYMGYSETVLGPFEPVGIITKNPLPKYAAAENIQGYYEAAVPALYLYWLKEKAETQANYALANVSINLLGTVTGIGVAANAATWTVRIISALDATSGALAAGLDVVPVEQTIVNKYGANSPEHDFITKIQLGLTIYNGVSAGANLLQLPQKLDEAAIFWTQNKQRLKDDLAVTQQQSAVIEDLLKGVTEMNEFIRGTTKSEFLATVSDFSNAANTQIADQAWDLWKHEKWADLEELFRGHNINFDPSIQNVWPPMFGFKNFDGSKVGNELNELIFDRFQKEATLGGSYASPVPENNSVYSLPSRALGVNYDDLIDLGQNYYYYKFKIINPPSNLLFKYGEAAPWFNELGGAIQIKSSTGFHNLNNHIELIEKWQFSNGQWTRIL